MSNSAPPNSAVALNAYLTLLKQKGASTASLNQRKHFLRYVLSALDGASANGEAYRLAVERALTKVATADTQSFFLTVAREFYPFWNEDLRTVAAMSAGGGFALESIAIPTAPNLTTLFQDMDTAGWGDLDCPALSLYLIECQQRGADDAVLDVRERLLRALMFVMRKHPGTAAVYRAAVNAMMQLMPREDTRRSFVQIIREFYPYWQCQADEPDSDL